MTMLNAEALLEIRCLRTWFPVRTGVLRRVSGHVRAVDGVDLTIFPGETLALVGESGCGKTTVGRTILQLVDATGGNIWYRGANLSLLSSKAFKPYRRQMQVVMQDPGSALDPRLTVRDCIAEGMDAFGIGAQLPGAHGARSKPDGQGQPRPGRHVALPARILGRSASAHLHRQGARRRTGAADLRRGYLRARRLDPGAILNLLADLQAEQKLTYLFITHDLGVVRYFATGSP